MKAVEWLRPLSFAVAKSLGVTDQDRINNLQRSWTQGKSGVEQFIEPQMMENRADETGQHIALSGELIDWLMQMRVDAAINSGGWHLPYKAVRIGVEQGSAASPAIAAWLQVHELEQALYPMIWEDHDRYAPDDWLLYVGIRSIDDDDGGPAVARALLDSHQIAEMVNGNWRNAPGDTTAAPVNNDEATQLRNAVRLTVALGIYLSLEGVNPAPPPKANHKKIAPPPRDRSEHYALHVLETPPMTGGRSAHLVRPHVRQLQDDRYYQGKWQNWPKGTRYVLVSGHIRGADAATHRGASERDQSASV